MKITKYWKINMMKIDPGAIGFTSGFSQEHKYFTVGEQITVEQLTELSIVMRISRYDHVYRHHIRDNLTDSCLHLLQLLHTSTTIQHASRVLSSREQSNALRKMT